MNLRRITSVVLVGGFLAAAPVVAAAEYAADEYDVAVTDTTPEEGEPFTVVVEGPVGNPEITLTISSPAVPDSAIEIAGEQSLTKATVDGDATFTVTLNEEAGYTLVATDADGTVLATQTITVLDDAAAAPGDPGADAGGGAMLPATGSDVTLYVAGAALLVAGGVAALVYTNRRRRTRV
jgi:LPXTG-motif cell wall-anchored protein